jgi:hypothetical protein
MFALRYELDLLLNMQYESGPDAYLPSAQALSKTIQNFSNSSLMKRIKRGVLTDEEEEREWYHQWCIDDYPPFSL